MQEGMDPTAEAETDLVEAENEPDVGTMRRALAELERAKERVERDAARAADELRGKLVEQLLPVLDNLDRTILGAANGGADSAHVQGMRLVRDQMQNVLARFGLERVDAKHQPFDPRIHDAISLVPVSHPSAHDVVIDQIEPGYRFGKRMLRAAKVVVGRYVPRFH